MNGELEAYLNKATRGLWGKKRLEVREELGAHLLERAHKHVLEGCTDNEAICKAIAELGDARTIRAGLIGVHMRPYVAKGLTLIAFTTALAVALTPRVAIADVQLDTTGPTKLCTRCFGDGSGSGLVWFELNSLTNALQAAGAKVSRSGTRFRVSIQNQPFVLNPSFQRGRDNFIVDWRLANAISESRLPWRVSGWHNATLTIGNVRISMNAPNTIVPFISVYRDMTSRFITAASPNSSTGWYAATLSPKDANLHVIQTGQPAGTVVALIVRPANGVPMFDLAPVEAQGRVTLRGWYDKLRFVSQAKDLTPYASQGRRNAVLLALTGRVSPFSSPEQAYTVLTPRLLESDALK